METNNFKSQVCTDKVQSERLLALGLKPETADCHLTNYSLKGKGYQDGWQVGTVPYCKVLEEWNKFAKASCWELIPAWSLHRLIEMMPFDVIPEGGFDNCFTLIKNYPKGYSVEYDGFSYYHKENIYDTIIEGIEHLIKEGYFPKEYLV